jgi:hypothetical protein
MARCWGGSAIKPGLQLAGAGSMLGEPVKVVLEVG